MRVFAKIFLFSTMVICAALSLSGYLLLSNSFRKAIEREVERAVKQYQVTKFALQANMHMESESASGDFELSNVVYRYHNINKEDMILIFSHKRDIIFSTVDIQLGETLLNDLQKESLAYTIERKEGRDILLAAGYLAETEMYMMVGTDITSIFTEHRQMQKAYKGIYCVVCLICFTGILIFSVLFVKPIKKMTRLAAEISQGDYSNRIHISTNDELGELGNSFNKMTDAVEAGFEELTRSSAQKEEFIADFVHELKTPLTSVIGYADMICQKDLSKEQAKSAAKYIFDEGMRLEALSLKLMDLVVLNSQEIHLEELEAHDVLNGIVGTMKPAAEKNNIHITLQAEKACIHVEHDLFKTMVMNLIDNAGKAEATEIGITAKAVKDKYVIRIMDNGCGIAEEDLKYITETFYVADKSRSRKQHGAGIGLALVKKIVALHNGELSFESELGKGTAVSIVMPGKGEI